MNAKNSYQARTYEQIFASLFDSCQRILEQLNRKAPEGRANEELFGLCAKLSNVASLIEFALGKDNP